MPLVIPNLPFPNWAFHSNTATSPHHNPSFSCLSKSHWPLSNSETWGLLVFNSQNRIFPAPSQSPHINPSPAFRLLLPCSLPDSPISLHAQPLSNPSPITPLDHLKTLTVDCTRFLLSLSLFLFPDVSTTSISDEIVALAFFHAPIF